jgi:hypothetical protein
MFSEYRTMERLVYKYCGEGRYGDLSSPHLRFTTIHELDDPFEGRFKLGPPEREKEKAVDDGYRAEWAQVELVIRSRMSTLGVLCVSLVPDDEQLWALYASEQRGFVLGIRAEQ